MRRGGVFETGAWIEREEKGGKGGDDVQAREVRLQCKRERGIEARELDLIFRAGWSGYRKWRDGGGNGGRRAWEKGLGSR